MTVAIPEWTREGLLPPTAQDPASADRSPYQVSLLDLVERFGKSPQRRSILDGLLRYRAVLHKAGLVAGFQWIDGSFAEHIEQMEQRSPKDVDVVTFYKRAPDQTPADLAQRLPDLFSADGETRKRIGAEFKVDGYPVDLALPPPTLVGRATYWYSMWSHRRDQTWKGYVEIDLAPHEDAEAMNVLAQRGQETP
jgi:hypothetical protein